MFEQAAVWVVLLHAATAVAQTGGAAPRGSGTGVATSSTAPEQTEAIDRFCDGLSPMTKEKARRRLFGLSREGGWVEFKREPDLSAAVRAEHVFEIAQVWPREDGATAVSMRFCSRSGDWCHFVEYCFRADGTLARLNSTLNTFNAVDKDPEKDGNGASRQRDRYFDASGKQIKVRKRVLDLKTKRPSPTLQVMDEEPIHKERIYKTAAALPFSALLKGQRVAQPSVAPDGSSPRR
jgi:hypothetical protein